MMNVSWGWLFEKEQKSYVVFAAVLLCQVMTPACASTLCGGGTGWWLVGHATWSITVV